MGKLSEYEFGVWCRLIEVLGGIGKVACSTDRRVDTVYAWRQGYRLPSVGAIHRLMIAVEGLEDERPREELLFELSRWRVAAVGRSSEKHEAARLRFFKRFGHWPRPSYASTAPKSSDDTVSPFLPGQSGIPRGRARLEF
jgi:hypothetical protein